MHHWLRGGGKCWINQHFHAFRSYLDIPLMSAELFLSPIVYALYLPQS